MLSLRIKRVLSLLLMPAALVGCTASSSTTNSEQVIKDICHKRIAVLGEQGSHGDGSAIAYKVNLTKKLISECKFNAVVFESSFYDMLALNMRLQKGEEISQNMLSSSMGWRRRRDAQIQDLLPFLYGAVVSKQITIGGLDDQTGSRGAFYSLEKMPKDLARPLPQERQEICAALLKQRIWSSYSANAPYTKDKRTQVLQCLKDIKTVTTDNDYLAMIANMERSLARDFMPRSISIARRDKSMFENLNWFLETMPPNSKVIVWTVNLHAAKDKSMNGKNLGAHIAQNYGDQSFALGFTSAAGRYRHSFSEDKDIPTPPPHSLPIKAFDGTDVDTRYIAHDDLQKWGVIPADFFSYTYTSYDWSKVFDGIVVFRSGTAAKHIQDK